jgi:curli biogenesis system outer membrane secretion channel CsgG
MGTVMSSKQIKHAAAVLSVVLSVYGCGTVEPKITESDILNAERNGTLQSLYTQVRDGQGLGKSLKPTDKSAYLKKIGTRLASQTSQKILSALNAQRLPGNAVPMSVLDQQSSAVEVIKSWDQAQYQTTVDTLNQEMGVTQKAIEVKKAVFESMGIDQLLKKNGLIDALKALHGSANQMELEQTQNQLFTDVYDLVEQQVAKKDFDQAITQLKRLVSVAPDFKDVKSKLSNLESTALQETFVNYVRDGETDEARKLLDVMVKGPYFAEQKSIILPSAIELGNYYIAMAVEATGEENLVDAYRLFSEARSVKSMFGMQSEEVTQEADFVDFAYLLYEEAYNKKSFGLALGYLSVIEQMRPNFPELETFKRLANDNVMNEAIKRVSTTAFNGDDKSRSLGRSISSKITQFVFDTLPQDVRVVEREQLNAVLREQEISALKKGTGVQIDSADLLIQGTILESDVESSSSDSSQKTRVVTERKEVNNPAYGRWLEMSSSERAKMQTPSRTLIKETKEDISIKVTYVRKVAVLSISYRVVDAKSARVLYADSVQDKKKVSDETHEGVQLGEYVSEHKVAELPSDSELLSELTVLLAKRIGIKVVELLKDPEIEYQKNAKTLFDERNYVAATEAMAKAYVMSLSKGKETAQLAQDMREYAVTARLEN